MAGIEAGYLRQLQSEWTRGNESFKDRQKSKMEMNKDVYYMLMIGVQYLLSI